MMTLLEHALQHIDNKIAEEEARLEDARRMLGFLQQERASLLAEAAHAPGQVAAWTPKKDRELR